MSEYRPIMVALLPAFAAGPLFVATYACASLYLQMPRPILLEPSEMASLLVIMVPASLVGFVIGFVPIALGGAIMAALSERFEEARLPQSWAAAGALAGAGLDRLLFAQTPWSGPQDFAIIATSAACATLCWAMMRRSDRKRLRREGRRPPTPA